MTSPVQADNNRAQILKDYYQVADSRPFEPAKLKAFYTDDLVDHQAHDPNANPAEAAVGLFASLAEGAPDSVHELKIVEPAGEDLVVVHWDYRGTHTGEMLGIPATGKSFDFPGMEIYRIREGKIADIWHVEDLAGMARQLGLSE